MEAKIIFDYFPDLTDKQKKQFGSLRELYADWNQKINVISRKDMDAFYERHVLHSLSIAKFISFSSGTKILDVGTGGGFPGIPLAIFFPDVHFHLVDSIGKKIKVVEAVAKSLNLKNVSAEHERMEKLTGDFDFVISRAVTQTKQMIDWTKHLVSKGQKIVQPNGWLFLKGGDLVEELRTANRKNIVYNLSDFIETPFFETKKLVHLKV